MLSLKKYKNLKYDNETIKNRKNFQTFCFELTSNPLKKKHILRKLLFIFKIIITLRLVHMNKSSKDVQ